MTKVLFIGHTLPEPTTTAAGTRIMQLIDFFYDNCYTIHFATAASPSDHSVAFKEHIHQHKIQLNDSSFNEWIKDLAPDIVVYDRFLTEEQYGWRVADSCPDAMRILDTEDLHFLRDARRSAVHKELSIHQVDIHTTLAQRELAAILRCDLSLIISRHEMELLIDTFKIPSHILNYSPIVLNSNEEESPSYYERKDFMTIGNLHHKPNADSVRVLKKHIWPLIKKQLPHARLHIYGNYIPESIQQLHNEKEGFLIEGWTPDLKKAISFSRILLAPLRYGAGLKGKIIDAMRFNTPVITTSIGAEGLYDASITPGSISDSFIEFATQAIEHYEDKTRWQLASDRCWQVLDQNFNKHDHLPRLEKQLNTIIDDLEKHRNSNFIGKILNRQGNQAHRYMSQWIEEKSKRH